VDMRKYAGGNYLRVDDVRDGPRRQTIVRVKDGNYDRPDAIFNDGSILSLNPSNVRVLAKAYSDDSELWTGREIELRLGSVPYQGRPTDSIIVAPISAPLSDAERQAVQERLATKNRSEIEDSIPF
jgi:hypothetical protein